MERLRDLPDLALSEFGTRRRHGFLWPRWCVEALKEGLGRRFIGTSNVLLAIESDLGAIGTDAHELPMVLAALAESDAEVATAPYRVLEEWRDHYAGNLLIVLPDTFGTTALLDAAPEWVAAWTGFRPDSAPPVAGGEQIVDWWRSKGRDPAGKLLIFSDGMDLDSIEETYRHASFAAQRSETLPMTGKLLGHEKLRSAATPIGRQAIMEASRRRPGSRH